MIQTDANGIALNQFTATKRPGDNYRVAVAGRLSELSPLKPYEPYDSVNTDPQHPELLPSADTSLFADRNDDNVRQANEPLLNEDNAGDGVHVSKMLTVWRKLYVEIDLMKAPPPGQVYPDDGEPVDMPPDLNAAGTALREPDDGLLQEAYAPAFIKIGSFAPNNTQITNQFKYVLVDHMDIEDPEAEEPPELPAQGAPFRDSGPESDAYWTVYVQSAYELAHNLDNDPDAEKGAPGYTTEDEPEYSLIFLETIRDRVASALDPPVDPLLAEKRVVAHEIAHHFLGKVHVDNSLMAQQIENATSQFIELHIKKIREVDKP